MPRKMKKVIKIVFTGGECSGKTTALNYCVEKLRDRGFTVFTVEEVATRLLTAGFSNELPDQLELFEKSIFKFQMNQNEIFLDIAESLGKDIVIIYDRGICDIVAYSGRKFFNKMLKENGDLKYGNIRDYYDAVFHLVTAADGALEYYSKKNNKHRILEKPEKAIAIDDAIQNAWLGHPHLRIIPNVIDGRQISFDEKIKMTLKLVCHKIGVPVPLEIEKKYLIKSIPNLKDIPVSFKKISIEQAYLRSNSSNEERIRKRGEGNSFCYYLTIKKSRKNGARPEIENQISEREYNQLMRFRDKSRRIIRKNRVCFLWKDQYFELDFFKNPKLDYAILEIELTENQQDVILPPFLKITKDVTEDKKYSNYEIAKIKKNRHR